jgi:hypothetical protein
VRLEFARAMAEATAAKLVKATKVVAREEAQSEIAIDNQSVH